MKSTLFIALLTCMIITTKGQGVFKSKAGYEAGWVNTCCSIEGISYISIVTEVSPGNYFDDKVGDIKICGDTMNSIKKVMESYVKMNKEISDLREQIYIRDNVLGLINLTVLSKLSGANNVKWKKQFDKAVGLYKKNLKN